MERKELDYIKDSLSNEEIVVILDKALSYITNEEAAPDEELVRRLMGLLSLEGDIVEAVLKAQAKKEIKNS